MTAAAMTDPVHWDAAVGALRVTGFTAASTVLRGAGWSSDLRINPLVSEEFKDMPAGNMLMADPPDHTRLRRLVSPAFTPKQIENLRPRVATIVEAVLGGLDEIGPQIDVLADIGYPVALAVITELLDVGVEGAELFAEQTPALARGLEFGASLDDLQATVSATTELSMFLTSVLTDRRRNPGDDFISALLALSGDDPDGLNLGEVMATCILLLIAGHETTANLIATSTLAVLSHPGALGRLLSDPGRAVEETLRLHGPIKLVSRTALADHDLANHHIMAGQAVLVDIQAANRDPWRYPDPLRLDLARAPVGHLSFGAGVHFCLGAALARLELVETLTRTFTRFPEMALTGSPTRWRESTSIHGLQELPVRLA